MTNVLSKSKRGLIAALFALALAVGLMPLTAFADDLAGGEVADSKAADPIDVYVSVSNKGTLALAHEKVTVTDVDKDGKLTYDEALQATHEKFCKGGYATEKTGDWLSITKLWNVEQGYYYLVMKNNVLTQNVGAETVAAGDELIAVVMEDTTAACSDHVGYFEKQTLTGTTADTFEFNLKGVFGMNPESVVAATDVQLGTWADGTFTALEGKKTDKDGKVSLTFDKPGTYVVSAKGPFTCEVVDWEGKKETKECALSAPVCVVSVAADPIDVYVSISNKGTLALAREKVTVKDLNADGKFNYDEAMKATHEQFCKGGYESGIDPKYGVLSVTKLWNVEQAPNYLFAKNNEMTTNVGDEAVAADDELMAVVMKDTESFSDYVSYFDKSTLSGTTADTFKLDLKAVYGVGYPPTPVAAPDVQVGTWEDGKFTALEGVKTDKDGKVELTFDKPGTYVVSAEGAINGEIEDWSSGEPKTVTKDCPLSAPVCVITVDGAMYRLYNPNSGEHLYTSSAAERDNLVTEGWTDEQTAWIAPAESATPVYRLYNSFEPLGDHHYTTSKEEYDNLVAAGWTGEDIGWYSDDAEGQAIYRVYNPNAYAMGMSGAHHYTASKDEAEGLVGLGWSDEQIGWYGLAAQE